MIGFLAGKIMENQDGKLLVTMSMGGGSSVGYQVSTPTSARYDALTVGSSTELYIHTHVREDAFDLIGFLTRAEKEIFLTLLSVNGIGPKGALGILSKVEMTTLLQAVLNDDKDSLTDVPGIGKKTAERIVLELADPLRKKMEAGLLPQEWLVSTPSPALGKREMPSGVLMSTKLFKEAKDALVGLGYREQEITSALKRIQETDKKEFAKTEEIVKLALKELM